MSERIPPEILSLLGEVFHPEVHPLWLGSPNKMLDDDAPIDLIAAGETERVAALLTALAEGVE